ncbi:aldo/keto reductase [Microbacterium sp.]|uniref:aldo/keto reductase n=1 Tax=Microbacterium sp. TaxID=51671 RepID=UPI000926CC8D|nr:aldo/keto reductase [Microbacterium sp.]MBN9189720.1 aldo/keto reductase [Microbacterium sp.]MBN9192518.1 aldo/keto reductase [Microbacterium sp.]OJU59360.1 MAG: aldehyde oxidoreductase [Microbacterium sp. 70-38]
MTAIDRVPTRRLAGGASIPAIGMGTFGSDHYQAGDVAAAVARAIRAGYRLIDCASVYGNEAEVGAVLHEAIAGGVPRDELFVMSKVWNDSHEPDAAIASVRRSLSDLRLDVLDAVFVHWPFPNHHAPFADAADRDPDARPYIHEEYMALWHALEGLVDEGIVRHLGTSNVTIPKLTAILADARIAPALNEMELHPCFQQPELFRFCLDHGIQPVGYSPLGSPSRPERDRVFSDVSDMEHPVVVSIARAHGVHPASICLKWAVQRGQIPIPFSVKESQLVANLRAVVEDPLTPAELEQLRSAEQNNRLIKGQVFLWPGAGSWLDLWDVDGTIPGWDGYAADSEGQAAVEVHA